jgi:thiamine transport system substrate-binding protein
MRFRFALCYVFLLLAAAPVWAAQSEPVALTVVTHDSFAVSDDVLKQFETDNNIQVNILRSGDAGAMVNKAILSKDNPLGDVMYGVDNTFLSRALKADIFEPYESPALKDVPDAFRLDEQNRVTPVDYGDVCLNYDVAYFEKHKLALPASLQDLTKPEYKSLLVVENPATSSPGLAFLLATIAQFGTEGEYTYLNYWADLAKNDVKVVDDWNTAYYTDFSAPGHENGDRPLVLSYASSPPVEVYFMKEPPKSAPTGAIVADGTCFRQIEFVGILKGAKNPAAAQKFIDFMLSKTFQEDMPLQMFVYPVLKDAKLPDVFTKYSVVPEKPATINIDELDKNREAWIQAWTETVLR